MHLLTIYFDTTKQSTVIQHHAKGHQDKYIKRSRLSWEASWNCHCDKMAKKAINDYLRDV